MADQALNKSTPTDSAYLQSMERLVSVVQELSQARTLDAVMQIVRHAARELTGADGATFVLRDGDQCYYAAEDAIAPLWQGHRFPMTTCISGWVMLHREHVVLEDIYADVRIPQDAYRPTFVKSLVMVPIRQQAPIGAIGNYWAHRHVATPQQVKLLQALADSASVALENVQLYAELEARVRRRTAELETSNAELEAFAYSISHDLRAPVRRIDGFSKAVLEDYDDLLDDRGRDYLRRIRVSTSRMSGLIDDLLALSRVVRTEAHVQPVDLCALARAVSEELTRNQLDRTVECHIDSGLTAHGDPHLLQLMLENLLGNAWKYTGRVAEPRVEVGAFQRDGDTVFFVRDNGAGFDMSHATRLFAPFQRLHTDAQFPGTGIGLATVQRIVRRHGGRIWAESAPDQGATFYFTLAPPSRLSP